VNLKGLLPQDVEMLEEFVERVVESVSVGDFDWDVKIEPLVRCSLARIAANRLREEYPKLPGEGWMSALPSEQQEYHILDWFVSSLIADDGDGAAWLLNVDSAGNPKKLMKCSSYDDLMREADRWFDKRHGAMAKALSPDDEETIADLSDGYSLVQMLTPEALDLESHRMHHCVGHGSYDGKLKAGWGRFLSLRDSKGRPVVTIELRQESNGRWSVQQIEGKRNARPAREIMDVVRDYAIDRDWLDREFFWPVVRASDGVFHDVDRIPEGATLRGDLDVGDAVFDTLGPFDLPTDLTVEGNMLISARMRLPERLTVCGYLQIDSMWSDLGSPLELPESLHVDKEIRIGSRGDIGDVIPTHLHHLVRVHRRKLVVRDGATSRWEEDVRGLDDDPFAPRM
jgi:hypothetical protein